LSVKAMSWAWEQPAGGAGRKAVLLALADHAGEDLTCYPSTARLAEKTELTAGTVRRYIDELEDAGLVSKIERRRRPDGTLGTWVYRLNQRAPAVTGDEADQRAPAVTGDPSNQWHPAASGTRLPVVTGARTSAHPCTSPARTGARAEPSLEPSMNPHPPQVPVQLTRERLAAAAGDQYARDEILRGANVRTPSGLARSKTRELLTKHADRLDALIARDARRRDAGLDPMPDSVLRGAALGDSHSLAHYPEPAQ
jgi:DNA-binding transcriptional ArsR family regulator